ncbi:winged helix-turn-helix domain-containing protein [Plantactinospora siamensis]|uniref:Winged helix-turn-helix domain-containing protein n=1 Tax=Plantactinospora siamensis TaxID=555372 RepID=A0ABV6NU43_9ACTN
MLRIHFSSEDVARTRVAAAADPLWELVLSLHLLQSRNPDPAVVSWRREVTEGLRRDRAAARFRLLFALNPPRGYFPDFLTPQESRQSVEAGLDAVRSTPVPRLHRDLTVLAADNRLPSPATALARGEPEALRQLTASMEHYRALAITPYWPRVASAVEADRGRRARALLDGGTDALLESLRPVARWRPGVLEVPDYPADRELHLRGRGLLLVPSFFCSRAPVALLDPTLPPVLVYPVDRLGGLVPPAGPGAAGGVDPAMAGAGGREALAALLGRTRASVLAVIDEGCSTGEVARRLRISPAAASQHASVLRNAGLLVSHRDRNTVLHTLTPLGRAMLRQ